MKFFKTIKMNLAKCLYYPNHTQLFDMKRLLITGAAFLIVVSFFLFLFYEAVSMIEYVSSAYFTTTILGIFLSFIDTTFKTKIIFTIIDDNIGGIVKKSEWRYFFSRKNTFEKLYIIFRIRISICTNNLHQNPSNCRKIQ